MTVIGLGAEERALLQHLDFSRNLSLDFWLFLEKHPAQWHDIFSVRTDDRSNSVSVQLRRRRLRISHGTGESHVVVLERDLHPKQLPLNTWLRVEISRELTDVVAVTASVRGGRRTFSAQEDISAEGALPYPFPPEDRPEAQLLSDSSYVGLLSGFRFQGADTMYVAYEHGRVVSNAAISVPLRHEINRVNRGTENEGVFIHALRTLGEPQFQLVEKKTVKPLEAGLVRSLKQHQGCDPAIHRIFPRIHWMHQQGELLTYVMEFVPGAWDRRRSNILEVFDLILGNLVDLARLGERHDLSAGAEHYG